MSTPAFRSSTDRDTVRYEVTFSGGPIGGVAHWQAIVAVTLAGSTVLVEWALVSALNHTLTLRFWSISGCTGTVLYTGVFTHCAVELILARNNILFFL